MANEKLKLTFETNKLSSLIMQYTMKTLNKYNVKYSRYMVSIAMQNIHPMCLWHSIIAGLRSCFFLHTHAHTESLLLICLDLQHVTAT